MISRSIDLEQPKSLELKIKKPIAQCCAVSGPNLLMLMCGMSIGFFTLLIPKLYQKDADIVVSIDELTWMSSITPFFLSLGGLVAGPWIDRVGRKPMLLLATVFFLLSWLLLYLWTTAAWILMLAFALLGFAGGIADLSTFTYISEITEVRYRGVMLTTLSLGINLGFFLQLFIGSYLDWRTCALVDVAISAVALVAIFFVPESPQWLANRGRWPKAERSLQWLRGWTDSASVKLEYDSMIESTSETAQQTSSSFGTLVQRLFRREVMLPFFMMVFGFFISEFNGVVPLTTYSVLVFIKIESPIDKYDATIVTGALKVLSMLIVILSIRRTGKRLITLGSLLVSGLAFLGVSVYVYLREHNILHQSGAHSWIPMTLMLLAIFVCAGGIESTTWSVASEIFPMEMKGICTSILGSICNVFCALANKSFLYMLDDLTLPGTFLFFAVINFFGLILLYWVMPETEDKTFAEIQQFFQKKTVMHHEGKRELDCGT